MGGELDMSDRLRRLSGFQTEGLGLEVAPYFNPVLLKSECQVHYTDYIGNDEIAAKAKENPTLNGRVPPIVDFVWTPGAPLKDCAPPGTEYDFALASHVMEHVPNPLGWLNEILSVMKTGATLRLFLPDKRTNNDVNRHETSFGELLSWWLERPSIPTPAQVADFMFNSLNDLQRDDARLLETPRSYSDQDVLNFATFVYNERAYIDVHCTVWTPDSFIREMQPAVRLGLLNVVLVPVEQWRYEFAVDLVKLGEPAVLPSSKTYPLTVEVPVPFPVEVRVPVEVPVEKLVHVPVNIGFKASLAASIKARLAKLRVAAGRS